MLERSISHTFLHTISANSHFTSIHLATSPPSSMPLSHLTVEHRRTTMIEKTLLHGSLTAKSKPKKHKRYCKCKKEVQTWVFAANKCLRVHLIHARVDLSTTVRGEEHQSFGFIIRQCPEIQRAFLRMLSTTVIISRGLDCGPALVFVIKSQVSTSFLQAQQATQQATHRRISQYFAMNRRADCWFVVSRYFVSFANPSHSAPSNYLQRFATPSIASLSNRKRVML